MENNFMSISHRIVYASGKNIMKSFYIAKTPKSGLVFNFAEDLMFAKTKSYHKVYLLWEEGRA